MFGNDFPPEIQVAINCGKKILMLLKLLVFRFLSGGAIAVLFFLSTILSHTGVVLVVTVVQLTGLGCIWYRTHKRRTPRIRNSIENDHTPIKLEAVE